VLSASVIFYFIRTLYYGLLNLIFFCFQVWVLTVFLRGENCYPNTVRVLCFKISDCQDFVAGFLSDS